ncbi:MAG: apolipoprotein D and lipocalin family protein [Paraglaciecola sp.]|jgi:apolipoprotein D and lipocalin family protein
MTRIQIVIKKSISRLSLSFLCLLLTSCVTVPEGITPVNHFDVSRYLGTWYEIARLDHSFERGLERVTAEYSLQDDGGVKVVNLGFNEKDQLWNEAQGKAYFVDADDSGHLKVSFFGPFYASYVIFALDSEDYQYAMITGPNRDYLWILARQPNIPEALLTELVSQAQDLGFDTQNLIYVMH